MRLTFSIFFILFLANSLFAQDLSDNSRYSRITLDGKEAYIDIQTGAIVYPNQVKTTTPTTPKPVVKQPTYKVVQQSTTTSPIQKGSYTVKRGDTLYSIARKYGMNAGYLAQINGVSANSPLSLGQRLVVEPKSIPTQYQGSTTTKTTTASTGTYRVKKGDTLYSIARRYGTTPQQIASNNGISMRSTLKVGQRLVVNGSTASSPTVYGNTYRVKKGDTLYSIARRTGITVYELKRLNGLGSNTISVGQVLKTR